MAHHLEGNKAVAHRFAEEWNKGNLDGVIALFADNYVDHNPVPGQAPGREGLRQALQMFFSAFPDFRVHADLVIAEGDKVVDHGYARGTHKGSLMGIAATGKPVTMEYSDVYRIVDGKIVEAWHLEDVAGVMAQIGAMPAPGGH